MKMEKRIFRVLMFTVLLVFLIMILMGVVQSVFVSHVQRQYLDELQESGSVIAEEYRSLADRSLENLAATKASEAEEVYKECCRMIEILSGLTHSVLTGREGPGEGKLSLPREDAPDGELSTYYELPEGVDPEDGKVRYDLQVFTEIASALESSIDPASPIYSAVVVTLSGPVLLSNGMEAQAFKDNTWMNEWSKAYRKSLVEEGVTDGIAFSIYVPDVITGEYCFTIAKPVFVGKRPWGVICYLIHQSYFDELVRKNSLDEHDVCFITSRDEISAFISSEKTGTFRVVPDIPDREKYLLYNTEKEAAQALQSAFMKSDSGQVNTRLNTLMAGSGDITFYYSLIETAGNMLVIGRPRAVTERYAQQVSNTLDDIISDSRESSLRYIGTTIVVVLLTIAVAFLVSSRLSRKYALKLTAPIRTLTGKVEDVRGDSLDFTWEAMGEPEEETEILAGSFSMMTARIKEDIKNITEMSAAREKVRAELSMASAIQLGMLPKLTDNFTAGEHFSLYAISRPARSVGGDFYDFFMLDENRLVFLIADVSDKGAGAAIFMAVSKSIIRTRALMGGTPGKILNDASNILMEDNDAGMFVTVFLCILDLRTGEVKACNAGHEPPVVLKKGDEVEGSFEVLEEEHGMPMALLPDMPFPEIEWQLHPGDRIFLRTDGVDEAQKEDGEMLGQDRMLEILNEHREEDDRSLCETIVEAVDRHVGSDPQFDDITVLSLTIKSLKE